jgi:hypothetical protein
MADHVVRVLQAASTVAELQAALLSATPFNDDAHPAVRDAVSAAQQRLRDRRITMLTANMTGEVPVARRDSHRERMGMLVEAGTRRSLDLDMAVLNKSMRLICRDYRCEDCSMSEAYKSVCLRFMLDCLKIRLQERLYYDAVNGYEIEEEIREDMAAFVDNPMRFYLDHHDDFANLPSMLERMHYVVVAPTAVDEHSRAEARDYELHAASVRKIVEAILRCEGTAVNAQVAATPAGGAPAVA